MATEKAGAPQNFHLTTDQELTINPNQNAMSSNDQVRPMDPKGIQKRSVLPTRDRVCFAFVSAALLGLAIYVFINIAIIEGMLAAGIIATLALLSGSAWLAYKSWRGY